jgi:ABC-2 type transport system permease protein
VRKVWAVIRREFVERVRRKWFWVMALLGPVFFGAIIFLPTLMLRGGGVKNIAVVDGTTQGLGERVTVLLDRAVTPDSHPVFRAVRVPAHDHVIDSLTAEVEAKRLEGFLILTDALVDSGRAEYQASNVSSFTAIETIERNLTQLVFATRLERAGVNPMLVTKARLPVALGTQKIAGGRATKESAAQSFSLAYFMAIILYTSILIYGINVMSSVLEEKTTRIVEVLVSSLRPFQLMLGKLIGVGAVSIFQFVIWAVSARYLIAQRGRLGGGGRGDAGQLFQVPHVTLGTTAVFVAYFLGGFFLYSAMFAAVGALSSNEQEARQAQQPVSVLLMVSFFGMFAMINDPNSPLAVTLSLIPFSAPIAMPVRWAAGNLPVSEIALSLALLVATIMGVTWVAARIYRVGILMTGKRPNLKELVRWVRAA